MSLKEVEIFRYTGQTDELSDTLFINLAKTLTVDNWQDTLAQITANIPFIQSVKVESQYRIIYELFKHVQFPQFSQPLKNSPTIITPQAKAIEYHMEILKIVDLIYPEKVPLQIIKDCLSLSLGSAAQYLSKKANTDELDIFSFHYFIEYNQPDILRNCWYKTEPFIPYQILNNLLNKQPFTYNINHLLSCMKRCNLQFNLGHYINPIIMSEPLKEIFTKVNCVLNGNYVKWDYDYGRSYKVFYLVLNILPKYIRQSLMAQEIKVSNHVLELYNYCLNNDMIDLIDTNMLIDTVQYRISTYEESKILNILKPTWISIQKNRFLQIILV